jgi:hypothetical protein
MSRRILNCEKRTKQGVVAMTTTALLESCSHDETANPRFALAATRVPERCQQT